jgi:hypothetical protein
MSHYLPSSLARHEVTHLSGYRFLVHRGAVQCHHTIARFLGVPVDRKDLQFVATHGDYHVVDAIPMPGATVNALRDAWTAEDMADGCLR